MASLPTYCTRIVVTVAVAAAVFAQTPPPDSLISPEVRSDRTVIFRLRAPKATEVSLYGDWMPVGKPEQMSKGSDGVWSATAGPINATGHLYWFNVDGLAIADPVNPKIKLRQRTSASLVEVPGDVRAAWAVRDVPHGSVVVDYAQSQVLNRTERTLVYLPPGYEKSSARYPVLYLLHGSGDVPDSWINAGNANFILDNLIAGNKAKPMVIVMPAGHAAPFGQTGAQQRNTELFEQYLLKEVIPLVEAKYRIAAGRQNRAIAGLSMGGGQTINVGFSHLDLFSAMGIFSAGNPAQLEPRFKDLLGDPAGTNTKLNVLWIGCGDKDTTVQYARVKQFAELLDRAGIHETFRTYEGGAHTWPVWRLCLSEFAPLLFSNEKARSY
ncbi:MAG: alpha/beta hydrolase-fold protein [Acidobacteriota bacterium]|nr:alpha/beta hydrolase-fold protein [Acidobacteriota bacterium]